MIRCADVLTDPVRQQVWREQDGARVLLPVQGLSLQLWLYLLAQGPRVVRFDELIAQVWAPVIVNEETVTQRVKLLRQALGDDGRQPRYVRSVRGQGYQLCELPERLPAGDSWIRATPPLPGPQRRWPAVALATTLALLLGLVGWWLWPGKPPLASVQDPVLERARYYARMAQQDDNERAIGLFQQVLDDPARSDQVLRHAAQLGLSQAWSARVCLYNQSYRWADQALALAERVLREAPQLGAAHAARAYALDCQGQLDAALAGYAAALALLPDATPEALALRASRAHLRAVRGELAGALEDHLQVMQALQASGAAAEQPRYLGIQVARLLELLGHQGAAEQRYREPFALVPDNPFIALAYPRYLYHQGRISAAEQALALALQRPRHPHLHILQGELALLRGDRPAAALAFAQAAALKQESSWPATLHLLHADPAPTAAVLQARLDALLSSPASSGWPENALELSVLHLALEHPEAALDALREAVRLGWRDRAWLQITPLFQPLARHPDFIAVLDEIAQQVATENRAALRIAGIQALTAWGAETLNPPNPPAR